MSGSAAVRVLFVDDDPDFAALSAEMLERETDRLSVETATDARAASDRLGDGDIYDCIVSDYDLPRRDGIEFLEDVREAHPDLPFVLFTGEGSERVASDAMSAGATDYFRKRSDTEQYALLANRICNAVDGYRAKRERESYERRLSRVHERITDGFFAVNADWEYTYVNEEGARLVGRSQDELLGERVWEAFPNLVDSPFEGALRTAMESQETTSIEEQYPAHNTWYSVTAYPAEDGISIYFRDVTERKQREEELERYETIVENTNDGIYMFDADGRFTFVNQRVVDVSGIPRDAWLGEHVSIHTDLGTLTEAEVAAVEEGIETIVQGDESEVSVEMTPDLPGESRHIELRMTPFRTGPGSTQVIGFSRDVTRRRERERTLAHLQRRTETLMETTTKEETARIAVETVDEVLDAQLSGFFLLGDDGQTLEPVAFVDAVRDGDDEPPTYHRDAEDDSASEVVWDAFERGRQLVIEDVREHGHLAEVTPARSAVVHPLADHGVFVVSSTERDAFDETDRAVVEIVATSLTAALDRVEREQELRNRNERLDEFASIVSHDLRNPLTVAQGRLAVLREDIESDHIDAIARAHDRMETLIDDLLTVAREGAAVEETEPVDLAAVSESCWRTVETPQATLAVGAGGTLEADPSRLKQLLENLLRNALEHCGDDVTVTIGALDDGFFVADDGPGIPEDARDRVFETGYSTHEDGTGFGLSIVREIAEAHGWDVRAAESEHGGARFEITGVERLDW